MEQAIRKALKNSMEFYGFSDEEKKVCLNELSIGLNRYNSIVAEKIKKGKHEF